jgi:hypothetical protein
MTELHPDWRDRMSSALWASGYRQSERHVKRLHESGSLPANAARTLLDDIDEGRYDLLAFFAPHPIALSSRKSWSRQYNRARTTTGLPRERTPALGDITDEDDGLLHDAFVEGLARGFYEALGNIDPYLIARDPEAVDEIIGQLLLRLNGSTRR